MSKKALYIKAVLVKYIDMNKVSDYIENTYPVSKRSANSISIKRKKNDIKKKDLIALLLAALVDTLSSSESDIAEDLKCKIDEKFKISKLNKDIIEEIFDITIMPGFIVVDLEE